MKRLRVLRLVVPAVLAMFVAVVAITVRNRPSGTAKPLGSHGDSGQAIARLEGFTITDIIGDRRRLAVSARVGSWDDSGGFQAEGIERIELDREGGTPLIVSAARGTGTGTQGKRLIRLEGDVEIRDEETGLLVKIPSAELDQGAGFARSLGEVVIASPHLSGKASLAVYPLGGRPTELYGVEIRDDAGGVLTAKRAAVPRGGRIVDLEGDVQLRRGDDSLFTDRLHVERDAAGAFSAALAVGAVRGASGSAGATLVRVQALRAELAWTGGEVSRIALRGDALLEQTGRTLQSDAIEALRSGPGWNVSCAGRVLLAGSAPSAIGRLEAASLEATLDLKGGIESGSAMGGVRFAGTDAAGESDSAELSRVGSDEKVTLRSGSGRRARMASGRTRVTAETIVTTGRGTRLDAEGRVEATLLAEPARRETARPASLFDGRETIHFVAARLSAEESGKLLRFRQNVRGWQADRNLSADEIDIDQKHDALDARGHVSTRLPRTNSASPSPAYLQVSSESLRYRGAERLAVYGGGVRARQDEGRIDCGRLEVALAAPAGGIDEVRAFDDVRIEFNAPPVAESAAAEPVTGNGDRLLYAPGAGWVRLFGDRAPAEVRRGGPQGGTTAGRVLRYALDSGRIEVESISPDPNGPPRGGS